MTIYEKQDFELLPKWFWTLPNVTKELNYTIDGNKVKELLCVGIGTNFDTLLIEMDANVKKSKYSKTVISQGHAHFDTETNSDLDERFYIIFQMKFTNDILNILTKTNARTK